MVLEINDHACSMRSRQNARRHDRIVSDHDDARELGQVQCTHYRAPTPICWTAGFHISRSLRMNSDNPCGDIRRVETLSASNFCLTSGWARAAFKSSLTLFATAVEVPGGATSANHPVATNPGTVSATVG